jgi:hypothetical protein
MYSRKNKMSFKKDSHKYLESLDKTHILLFHEEQKDAEEVEFDFIKSGLEKNQRCFYTTKEPDQVIARMKQLGIKADENIRDKKLNIIPIPETFKEYAKVIEEKVLSLPKKEAIRVISTHYLDFDSEKKTEKMEKIEQWVDDNFDKIPGNFMCSFHIPSMETRLAKNFMKNLLDCHRSVLILKDKKLEKFEFT